MKRTILFLFAILFSMPSKPALGFLVPPLICVCIDYRTGAAIRATGGRDYIAMPRIPNPHGMLCGSVRGAPYEGRLDPDHESRLSCGNNLDEAYENADDGPFALWTKKVQRLKALSLAEAFGGLGLPPVEDESTK